MMPDSPPNPQTNSQNPKNPHTQKRICDFCSESTALIYCKADSAKLCFSCDREVHSTNQLFTKHTRFQLCDNCDSSPASILCFTENSVLCQNCDFEVHRFVGSCPKHDRRPLEGFCGCPCAIELSGFVGFEGFDGKCLGFEREKEGFGRDLVSGFGEENDGFFYLFGWDTPAVVSIDELIGSTDKSHSFQATVVRPFSKDRNLSCGKHKQEILDQLHKLAKSEPNIKQDSDSLYTVPADENETDFTIQHMLPAHQYDEEYATSLRGREVRSYTWGTVAAGEAVNDHFVSSALSETHIEESFINSDRHSSMCSSANHAMNGCNSQENPIGIEPLLFPPTPKVATHEFNSADRGSALSRYKEKKRTRRFDKQIRYESRKVQAEHRTRIKGRFAKINHCMNQVWE